MNEEIGHIVVGEPMKEFWELLECVRITCLIMHGECIHLYTFSLGLWGLDLSLVEGNIINLVSTTLE